MSFELLGLISMDMHISIFLKKIALPFYFSGCALTVWQTLFNQWYLKSLMSLVLILWSLAMLPSAPCYMTSFMVYCILWIT